jgi:hypothetical protein
MNYRARAVKNRLKRRIFWSLAVCWFLTAAVPLLYAAGNQDQSLSQADELIRAKQYDEAILLLGDFAKRNPNRFGEAQQRLQYIYRTRTEYNTVANELLDTVVETPDDVEKILALTNRLEELEDVTNPQVRDFIFRTRELAQFNYNRSRLERILVEGRALIDQGEYQRALLTYAGGMDLYRDEFFTSGFGELIEERVRQGIASINLVVGSFPAFSQPLGAAASELAQAGNQGAPVSRLEDMYRRLDPLMDSFIEQQQTLYSTVNYFDEQLAEFQTRDRNIGDRNFLSFASRLISGRAGETSQEGILGVLEAYWNSTVGNAENALARFTDQTYSSALDSALNGNYSLSQGAFGTIDGYSKYPLGLLEKRRQLKAGENPPVLELFNRVVLKEDAEKFFKYAFMTQAAGYLVQGSSLGIRHNLNTRGETRSVERWREGSIGAQEALGEEQLFHGTVNVLRREADELLVRLNSDTADSRSYRDTVEVPEERTLDVLVYFNNARSVIESLRVEILALERDSAIRYYTIANSEFERRLEGRREEFAEGSRLIEGISRTGTNGEESTAHYPTEGLAILTRMNESIGADTETGNALLSRYSEEPGEIISDSQVGALQNSARSMLNELASLRTRGQGLSVNARSQVAQAEAYRNDGDRLYRESQTALSRQNFDTARDRLQRATERYSNSLAIQESQALRSEWDTQLVNLGQEINRIENEIVVRDVRNLVNNAKTTYYAGKFEQAEDLLVRAQNRWHVTNVGEDEEVMYWLRLVRGALSLRSGRVISPTAPLYPEMSQLLSEAKKDYEEGVRYINASRRSEGIAKFNDARQKTREVKLMFPVNQEAGILDLRMDQVTDPAAFNESFIRRFNEAVAGTKRRSLEAFADLQNLAEINPRYTGMAAALVQAEIDMGYRPPPPDPRDLALSAELTAAARRIVDGNIRAQFEVAVRQLNEALALNPNNTQAQTLKDRAQTELSGTRNIVMDSDTLNRYNEAVMELQRGNNLVALSIVQQLLQNPKNQRITQILELQRRIQSLL